MKTSGQASPGKVTRCLTAATRCLTVMLFDALTSLMAEHLKAIVQPSALSPTAATANSAADSTT